MTKGIFSALMALLLCTASVQATGFGWVSDPTAEPAKLKYSIIAWPKGATGPVRFRSAIYSNDTLSYVRIDDGALFVTGDFRVRTPEDLDSMRATLAPNSFIRDPEDTASAVWYTALRVGKRWGFVRFTGPISVYTRSPGRGSYVFMDTGAGIEAYSEKAIRAKLVTNPDAAQLLRQEKIGHSIAWGMGIGGLGLLVGGITANAVAEGNPGNVLVIPGLVMGATSWIPHLMVQGKYEAAIRAYNEAAAAK
jgi:hypothetical protein